VTYDLEKTTSQYGSVSRGICRLDSNSNLLSVVEHSKIEMQNGHLYSLINEQRIKLNKSNQTSMNFIGFSAEVFENISMYFRNFLQQNISHPNAEFFLPDILRQLIADKKGIVKCIHTDEQWFGVTYKQDKIKVKKSIKNLIKSGQYPSQLFG
jgi:NDP-sugar pyrophosphorylase family protein